jgi:hypothetical protein
LGVVSHCLHDLDADEEVLVIGAVDPVIDLRRVGRRPWEVGVGTCHGRFEVHPFPLLDQREVRMWLELRVGRDIEAEPDMRLVKVELPEGALELQGRGTLRAD